MITEKDLENVNSKELKEAGERKELLNPFLSAIK